MKYIAFSIFVGGKKNSYSKWKHIDSFWLLQMLNKPQCFEIDICMVILSFISEIWPERKRKREREIEKERERPLLFAVPLISWSFKCIIQRKTKQKSSTRHPGLNIHAVCLSPLLHRQRPCLLLFDMESAKALTWPLARERGGQRNQKKYQNQHEIAGNYWRFFFHHSGWKQGEHI